MAKTISESAMEAKTPKEEVGTNKLYAASKTKDATTHNGAVTNSTSLDPVIDMFFLAGASRNMSQDEIETVFASALGHNLKEAIKVMFWARDIRGGAGERRFFRICLNYLTKTKPEISKLVTKHVPDYGRWDDIFHGDVEEALDCISDGLKTDNALLYKWLPREKSSQGHIARWIMDHLDMTPREYRQMVSKGSNTVEDQMSKNEWDKIEYTKIPSMAFNKYRNAYMKRDEERFSKFIEMANEPELNPEAKINAGAIFPQNLYDSWRSGADAPSINAQWKNLPDFGNEESILPVCDVSGSMSGTPMSVSVSLGVYLSERNKGEFKDIFCTFSGTPELQKLSGDVVQRFQQLRRANWEMNTDLEAVFDLMLELYNKGKVKEEDLPKKVLIISDMEFDYAKGDGWRSNEEPTNFESIDGKFKKNGLTTPQVVFWNVNGRLGNVPVSVDSNRVAMVSGFSPSILKSVLGGEDLSPRGVLEKTINTERYSVFDML